MRRHLAAIHKIPPGSDLRSLWSRAFQDLEKPPPPASSTPAKQSNLCESSALKDSHSDSDSDSFEEEDSYFSSSSDSSDSLYEQSKLALDRSSIRPSHSERKQGIVHPLVREAIAKFNIGIFF